MMMMMTITHSLSLSLSHILTSRNHTLSYILTYRDILAWPASDTQINTCNMGAYILCDFFLSCSAFLAGLVPVSCTVSDISLNPERDKKTNMGENTSS